MQLTTNFKLSEFQCGSQTPANAVIVNAKMLAIQLQKVRDSIGSAISVVNGLCTYPDGRTAAVRSNAVNSYNLGQKMIQLMTAGQMVKGNVVVHNDFVVVDILGKQTFSDKRTNIGSGTEGSNTNPTGGGTLPISTSVTPPDNTRLLIIGAGVLVVLGLVIYELK